MRAKFHACIVKGTIPSHNLLQGLSGPLGVKFQQEPILNLLQLQNNRAPLGKSLKFSHLPHLLATDSAIFRKAWVGHHGSWLCAKPGVTLMFSRPDMHPGSKF